MDLPILQKQTHFHPIAVMLLVLTPSPSPIYLRLFVHLLPNFRDAVLRRRLLDVFGRPEHCDWL